MVPYDGPRKAPRPAVEERKEVIEIEDEDIPDFREVPVVPPSSEPEGDGVGNDEILPSCPVPVAHAPPDSADVGVEVPDEEMLDRVILQWQEEELCLHVFAKGSQCLVCFRKSCDIQSHVWSIGSDG